MSVIRIQERPGRPGEPNAAVIFEHSEEYPLTLHDPFTEQQEADLEWYFEQHLEFPFLHQVKKLRAAESITAYGEALFEQIFADPDAYALYKQALQAGLNTLQLEIAGAPSFHRWHWEALKDPRLPQPLALQATMIRKNITPVTLHAQVRSSPTIHVLLVTARPYGKRDVGYRTISRPLVETLR